MMWHSFEKLWRRLEPDATVPPAEAGPAGTP